MPKYNPLSTDPEEIKQMWYIHPEPQYNAGWVLYSRNFVLQILQGCYGYPEKVKHNSFWDTICMCFWTGMILAQVAVMFLCYIPVISWVMRMLARAFPRDAAGFFLRGCYWKAKLRCLGVDTLIDQGVEINRPDLVEIGSHCHIERNVLLSVGVETGKILIGDNVFIGPGSHIAGRGSVEIRSFVAIAAGVHIYSATNLPYHPERVGQLISMSHAAASSQQYVVEGPVTIGEYVVVGYSSLILPGVNLGFGAVVHPFSEVSTSFPDFAIITGHGKGRQKGWRRPARLDPRLKQVDATNNTNRETREV